MRMKSSLLGLSIAMTGLMGQSPLGRSNHHIKNVNKKPYSNVNGSKPTSRRKKVKLARKQKHRK